MEITNQLQSILADFPANMIDTATRLWGDEFTTEYGRESRRFLFAVKEANRANCKYLRMAKTYFVEYLTEVHNDVMRESGSTTLDVSTAPSVPAYSAYKGLVSITLPHMADLTLSTETAVKAVFERIVRNAWATEWDVEGIMKDTRKLLQWRNGEMSNRTMAKLWWAEVRRNKDALSNINWFDNWRNQMIDQGYM